MRSTFMFMILSFLSFIFNTLQRRDPGRDGSCQRPSVEALLTLLRYNTRFNHVNFLFFFYQFIYYLKGV